MARIKIEQLPVMEDMEARELKGIFGGGSSVRIDGGPSPYGMKHGGGPTVSVIESGLNSSYTTLSSAMSKKNSAVRKAHDLAKSIISNLM